MDQLKDLLRCLNVIDSSHNGVVVIDAAGTIIVFNESATHMVGMEREHLIGRFMGDVFPEAWGNMKKIMDTGVPQVGIKFPLGNTFVIANRNPIYGQGKIIGLISIFQDISEFDRIASELELYMRHNAELNAIINSSYDGLRICDNRGKIIQMNTASEAINQVKAGEVIGRSIEHFVEEGIMEQSVTLKVLESKKAMTLIQRRKGGRRIIATGNPVFNDEGEIKFVVVNERDITELNRLQTELEKSRGLTRRYQTEISQLHSQNALMSDVVARSDSMNRVFNTAMKVAQTDSTILIRGESGVGKGLLCKIIHQASERKKGPFIRVDCGAIPESLIESELFGYVDGAFTGARARGKAGYFELADGGTLFLDEVGELPLNIQVKLLRFLENNEVVRVGSGKAREMDVRVIAATHRDLEGMVERGEYRKDLFFRLNVIPLTIPPLRERQDDIAPLTNHFLERFNLKRAVAKVMAPAAVDALCRYSFPGNIRELVNIIERLVVLTPGERIEEGDLPAQVRLARKAQPEDFGPGQWDLRKAVDELELSLIRRALDRFGTQQKAAAHLGINQSTLARKLQRAAAMRDASVHNNA